MVTWGTTVTTKPVRRYCHKLRRQAAEVKPPSFADPAGYQGVWVGAGGEGAGWFTGGGGKEESIKVSRRLENRRNPQRSNSIDWKAQHAIGEQQLPLLTPVVEGKGPREVLQNSEQ